MKSCKQVIFTMTDAFIYSMLVHNNLVQEAEYSQSAGLM